MPDVSTFKICRECSRSLPLTEYHVHKGCRDGLQKKCRDCVKAYRAEYYQKNADRLRSYSVEFYKENADHVKNYQKEYAVKNPTKLKERSVKYRAANRPRLLAAKQADYQRNKPTRLRQNAAYRKAHPEYARLSTYKRKARLKDAPGYCSAAQLRAKGQYHGWRCYLCQTSLTIRTAHMDHRKPLARGGSNWPANLAPACGPCNLSKGRKTEQEYRATQTS